MKFESTREAQALFLLILALLCLFGCSKPKFDHYFAGNNVSGGIDFYSARISERQVFISSSEGVGSVSPLFEKSIYVDSISGSDCYLILHIGCLATKPVLDDINFVVANYYLNK